MGFRTYYTEIQTGIQTTHHPPDSGAHAFACMCVGSGHATENDTAETQEKAVDYTPAFMEEEQEEQGEEKEEYYTVSFDDFLVQAQGPEMP